MTQVSRSTKIKATEPMARLLEIMDYLRNSPDGCAWTKEQTHRSLVPYLIEESYETAETIDKGQTDNILRDELGDLLLQITFHAEIARERGAFTFDDVAQAIVDKLERRYPTILGDEPNTLKTAEEIDKRWEEIKTEERKAKGIVAKETHEDSILDEISNALPALMRTSKIKGRVSKAGFKWPNEKRMWDKVAEEMNELQAETKKENIDKSRIASEIGDILSVLVDVARWYDIDAEDALRETNNRFETRFRYVESGLKKIGKDFKTTSIDEWGHFWDEAKNLEKK